ncbi:unnamed protein product [Malus baccata var. baccata]
MPMISQKWKRPLVSTRIPPLPSLSRSTSVIRAAPPTFCQERNMPNILRAKKHGSSMTLAGKHHTFFALYMFLDISGANRTSLHRTQSQPIIGTRETSYQHRDVAKSQLDDTHNDLPTEAPTRKRSAIRRVNGYVPNLPNERPVRGACRLVKTNRIVCITQAKIKVVIDPVLGDQLIKLFIACWHIIRRLLFANTAQLNTTYWKRMFDESKSDLISKITEFKYELHAYFLEWALANPPIEMDSRPGNLDNGSFYANIFSQKSFWYSQKKYEHHAGSRPLAYIVEECTQVGSQFPEIDTFEIAYARKNKNWTNETAKSKFDEMVTRKEDYPNELAKDYPEDTPLNEIAVLDQWSMLRIILYEGQHLDQVLLSHSMEYTPDNPLLIH